MPLTLFDSHAHYDDSAFDCDREALLDLLPSKGVCGIVNAASDLSSTRRGIALAERYPYVWAAAGIHPQEAGHWCDEEGNPSPEAVQDLRALCSHPRVVAVGEIGLDYYYDTPGRECQRRWLRCQLALAAELHLPVILHDREAHEDTLKLLRQHPVEGVVHCFSGSVEMARELVRLGYYIGLGGAVTFKNARRAPLVAAAVPADRLLLETDAPYMTPVPFRGKRNQSDYIAYTARRIAELRGITAEELCRQTAENTRRLFRIPE